LVGVGVIEGFFGPEWSWQSRTNFCKNLPKYGGDFYIYAPKRDPYLRKSWTEQHPSATWNAIKSLSATCRGAKVVFGVGLSPFELHAHWNESHKQILRDKVKSLVDLDIQYLGLFFDDMRGSPDLAEQQIEIVEFVQTLTDRTILFCPTYYSPDPILDKVFGARPENYLQKIGTLSSSIQILWTGSRVIPDAISGSELDEVAKIIRRKPFIWDNCFANDGPKNCKFLKLKPLAGRSPSTLNSSSGWALNLMNQPNLSEILFVSSTNVLRKNMNPEAALASAAKDLAGDQFASLMQKHTQSFLKDGRDKLASDVVAEIRSALDQSRFAQDVRDWLDGKYIVGPECLTD